MRNKAKFLPLRRGLSLLLIFLVSFPLGAMSLPARAADDCGASKWPLSHESTLLRSAPVTKSGSGIGFGEAVRLDLSPVAGLAFAVAPDRKPAPGSYGAILTTVMPAGTVQITLSGKAWIDLVQNGQALVSTDHTEGKGCPGVAKSVRFRVAAGPATIQVSGARADSLGVAILPAD